MTISLSRPYILIISAFAMFFSGCASTPPSRFYVMNPTYKDTPTNAVPAAQGILQMGVGPVELPHYLNRPQIITRISENEVEVADFDKWAEPLDENICRVLVENLGAMLEPGSYAVAQWKVATNTDYRIAVKIIRFEGSLTGSAYLEAHLNIFESQSRNLLTKRHVAYSEPVQDNSYEALVRAQEKMLADLSEDISGEIRSVIGPRQQE